jgi:hypothetical protein
VKEADSTFRKVLVIVRINNQIGILLENNNDNYIMINLLPEQITDNWIIVDSQPAPAVYPEVRPKGLRKIGAPVTSEVAVAPAVAPAVVPLKKGIAKIGKPVIQAPTEAISEIQPAAPVKKGLAKIPKKNNTLRRSTAAEP